MKFKKYYFLLLFIYFSLAVHAQEQIGQDIVGEDEGDRSGWSTSFNAEGTRVAIGTPFNNAAGEESGHVRVFDYNSANNTWEQIGQDIDGEENFRFGYSVSLSADGSTLVIGHYANLPIGCVCIIKVYKYNSNNDSWSQFGQDINEETFGHSFGYSVSISADGLRVAIGAPFNGGSGGHAGTVRVYQYNTSSNDWQQLGQDILGEEANDWFGYTVCMSADGTILAIGAPNNDAGGSNSGHVRVYRLIETWVQLGQSINGEAAVDGSGRAISLSADGTRLAIGARLNDGNGSNSGHVRVFDYDDVNNDWLQIGQDINGENPGDHSGVSVSLSADGASLAIGAIFNDGSNSINSGHVRVYEFNNGNDNWQKSWQDIDGENNSDKFGFSVSFNADGSKVAVGAPYTDGNGASSGYVRIYQKGELGLENNIITKSRIVLYPNPVNNNVTIYNPQYISVKNIKIYDLMGSLKQKHDLREMKSVKTIDISHLSNGIYMVIISSENGQILNKLVKE